VHDQRELMGGCHERERGVRRAAGRRSNVEPEKLAALWMGGVGRSMSAVGDTCRLERCKQVGSFWGAPDIKSM
jgi:hypothetical protein